MSRVHACAALVLDPYDAVGEVVGLGLIAALDAAFLVALVAARMLSLASGPTAVGEDR